MRKIGSRIYVGNQNQLRTEPNVRPKRSLAPNETCHPWGRTASTSVWILSRIVGCGVFVLHLVLPRSDWMSVISVSSSTKQPPGVSIAGKGAKQSKAKPIRDEADTKQFERYKCTDCGSTGLDENPCPLRHTGEYLNFINFTQCCPCRNLQQTLLWHMDRPTLQKTVKGNKKKMDEYRNTLSIHEKLFDATPPRKQFKIKDADALQLPTWVNIKDVKGQNKKN